MNGKVKKLVADKGFGFLIDDSEIEYFFHRSAVIRPSFERLTEGQQVTFDTEQSSKGPRATNVVGR